MNEIKQLFELDIIYIVAGLIIIISAVNLCISAIGSFSKHIGKPVRWVKSKDADHRLLLETAAALADLQEKQAKDVDESIRHDKNIRIDLENIIELLKENAKRQDEATVVTLRSTLYGLHKEFTESGYVTKEGLKTFIECGTVYERAGGDDIYHEKLYPEVMRLQIR